MADDGEQRLVTFTRHFRLTQVRQDLFQITLPCTKLPFGWNKPTNCWLLLDPDGFTLVDAGYEESAAAILEAIEFVSKQVIGTMLGLKRVVITHAHPDHGGAASRLCRIEGVEVYAHTADCEYFTHEKYMHKSVGSPVCRFALWSGWLTGFTLPRASGVKPLEHLDRSGSLTVGKRSSKDRLSRGWLIWHGEVALVLREH